jgi:hypothetical protein
MLLNFKRIAPEFATKLYAEALLRRFDNRRQLAVYAGLAPPLAKGNDQTGAGGLQGRQQRTANDHGRAGLALDPVLACLGACPLVPETRAAQRDRLKKPTIVALARKLLVALRNYATAGLLIEGAVMKAALSDPLRLPWSPIRSVDPGKRTETAVGVQRRPKDWSRFLVPVPAASGIMVRPARVATVCQLDKVRTVEPRYASGKPGSDTKERKNV